MEHFISTYGYAAIVIGTFLEGETVLVLGGFAAHRGYLQLPWVLVSAFAGTLLGDQLYFFIGRSKGQAYVDKRPVWKTKSEKVFSLLSRNQVGFIIGFRFLYGLRTVTPFVIGASGISPMRFLLLNCLGASIWASVIGVLGYLFGNTFEIILGDIKHYELRLFLGLALLGMGIWLVSLWRDRR